MTAQSRSQAIRAKLIAGYRAEQEDHVTQITEGLLALEQGAGDPQHTAASRQAILERIFREAHSLKGAARALGLAPIQELAHGVEDLLAAARAADRPPAPEHYDLIYRSLDACGGVLAAMEAGDTSTPIAVLELVRALQQAREAAAGRAAPEAGVPAAPAPATPAAPEPETEPEAPAPGSAETIRVALDKLDALMAHLSDLVLAQIRAEQRLIDVRALHALVVDWQHLWLTTSAAHQEFLLASEHPMVAPWQTFLQRNRDNLNAAAAQLAAIERQMHNDRLRLSLVGEALEDEVKRVRVLPLSTITGQLARMVRDLARSEGKEVSLRLIGVELELDKRVLELVKDPLMHLLRNAVDHGVENPEVRARRGKPSDGLVTLEARAEGNYIMFRVSDDGAGLDLDAIRERALERGVITPERLAAADDRAVAELIFLPGFSTSRIITDLSGRGVGLDVVRHNVEELQGTVSVSYKPGRGATFVLRVPITLTSLRGLLVRAGGQMFALPFTVVERIVRFDPRTVASVEGRDALVQDGQPVGLVRLHEVLGLPELPRKMTPAATPDKELAVVVALSERAGTKRLALLVDELVGEQEIVMKKLTGPLSRVAGIAGVTVLGTGRAVLILNAVDILRLAARGATYTPVTTRLAAQAQQRRKTVLVVDDSVTTRTLEKNLLTGAGYDVRLAMDGEEALASLVTEGAPDLVITDVLMPRLDGFSLTQRLRGDERFRDLPVILVTSLDSPSDKARGIAVGADAYIVKGDFDQSNLLATIEQLL